MTYLIILFATYNDGTDDKKAMYTATTKSDAIATFHNYMGSYMKNEKVSHLLCMVIAQDGTVYKNETWDRPSESAEATE